LKSSHISLAILGGIVFLWIVLLPLVFFIFFEKYWSIVVGWFVGLILFTRYPVFDVIKEEKSCVNNNYDIYSYSYWHVFLILISLLITFSGLYEVLISNYYNYYIIYFVFLFVFSVTPCKVLGIDRVTHAIILFVGLLGVGSIFNDLH